MDCEQLFSTAFKNLTHTLRAEIIEKSTCMELREGQVLLDYGQTITAVPLVIDGVIKVMRIDQSGKELLVYYIHPGETCAITLASTIKKEQSSVQAVVQRDCTILVLPINTLFELRAKHLSWNDYMVLAYSNRIAEIMGLVDDLGFHHINYRIQKYLKEKAVIYDSRQISISHQEIANDLGTSREVISRQLKKMEHEGLLELSRECIRLTAI